jgi:hypothetical protein
MEAGDELPLLCTVHIPSPPRITSGACVAWRVWTARWAGLPKDRLQTSRSGPVRLSIAGTTNDQTERSGSWHPRLPLADLAVP